MTAVGGKHKQWSWNSPAINTNASVKARTVPLSHVTKGGWRRDRKVLLRVCISLSSLCYAEKICKNGAKPAWRCTPGASARQELSAGGWLELGVEASLGNITISGGNTGTKGKNQVRALDAATEDVTFRAGVLEVMDQVKGSHMRRLEKKFRTEHFSCRGPESGLQHPHWVAHTPLYLQGTWHPLPRRATALSCTY